MAYTWAGLEPDVSLADIPYYAGYLGLGAAMLVIILTHRQDARRVDVDAGIDALTVVVVSVLVLWSIAVHGIVTDTSMSASDARGAGGVPGGRRRAPGAGAPRPFGTPPPGGSGFPLRRRRGCWLVSDLGYLLFLVSDTVSAVLDVGWMVGGMLIATSTWRRPGPTPAAEPEEVSRAPLGQLGLAILPLLVPPILLVVVYARGPRSAPPRASPGC